MPFAVTQMDLEIIILSEISQTEKDKYYITYMWNLKNNTGSSLVAEWLGFWAFTAVAWVQSLVGELRSHKSCGVAKKKIGTNELIYKTEIESQM